MLKKLSFILCLPLFISACTREVYLQRVECEDCGCPDVVCPEPTPDCCMEVAEQTEIQVFRVYDVPTQPIVYQPCIEEEPQTNCRTVCKVVPVGTETSTHKTVTTTTTTYY
jgi:hypothetical protein